MSAKSSLLLALLLALAALGCRHDDSKRILRIQPPGQLTAIPK